MSESVFVSTDWLAEHLDDASVVVIDVRPPFFYAQGHIPGAISLPIFLYSDPAGPPPAAAFRERLGKAGVSAESHIVACDDGASPMAARLYWVLRAIGHERCSILDGGVTRWLHEDRVSESEAVRRPELSYGTSEANVSVRADLAAVREALNRPDVLILDVRSPAEYLGLQATASRNGHIPGAVNVEWSNAIGEIDGLPALQDESTLRRLYEDAGARADRQVIVYCQSGSRSSYTFAVLKHLGYAYVSNYSGGWQEWGNTPHLPVEE